SRCNPRQAIFKAQLCISHAGSDAEFGSSQGGYTQIQVHIAAGYQKIIYLTYIAPDQKTAGNSACEIYQNDRPVNKPVKIRHKKFFITISSGKDLPPPPEVQPPLRR